jgi:hypothetical protein
MSVYHIKMPFQPLKSNHFKPTFTVILLFFAELNFFLKDSPFRLDDMVAVKILFMKKALIILILIGLGISSLSAEPAKREKKGPPASVRTVNVVVRHHHWWHHRHHRHWHHHRHHRHHRIIL